jgi:hypothetical protein
LRRRGRAKKQEAKKQRSKEAKKQRSKEAKKQRSKEAKERRKQKNNRPLTIAQPKRVRVAGTPLPSLLDETVVASPDLETRTVARVVTRVEAEVGVDHSDGTGGALCGDVP